ncbi:MAG: DUF418 domain-containing protein [Flavobacteriales bacterium]|nr:DUF418 domain-containing protein [Flavobacteriales bacterium]
MSAPATERTHLLDALRGFALFGVVWSNYAFLSTWIIRSPEEQAALPGAWLDVVLGPFHDILIDGKFYSIFSLLFGIGFGFFLDKGGSGQARFLRRMLLLLLIGVLHLRFLWAGDILSLYAILGLLLPLFRHVGDRALLVIATVLLLSPIAVDTARVLTNDAFYPAGKVADALEAEAAVKGSRREVWLAVSTGGWKEFTTICERFWLFRIWIILDSNRPQKVLALFLIGLWIARRKLFADPTRHRTLFKRICIAGATIGLPFCVLNWYSINYLPQLPEAQGLVGTVSYAFGVVLLALAYASGFALLWTDQHWQKRFEVLAPMGRMALTNYLMQTVIGIFVFYGIGLGLGGRVSMVGYESIALAVFIVQVIWSRWWLVRFQYGPFEWAWRSLTYGKVMAMRK